MNNGGSELTETPTEEARYGEDLPDALCASCPERIHKHKQRMNKGCLCLRILSGRNAGRRPAPADPTAVSSPFVSSLPPILRCESVHSALSVASPRSAAYGSVISTRNSMRNSESPKLYSNIPAATMAARHARAAFGRNVIAAVRR